MRETERVVLRLEADYLHRALFCTSASHEIQEEYEAAVCRLQLNSSSDCDVIRLKEAGADLEAIEIVLRRNNALNPLSQRFQVICYLAEIQPVYFHQFVNEHRSVIVGLFSVGWCALRSMFKYMEGKRLIRKHGIG